MGQVAAIYARKSTDQSAVADEAKSVRRQIDHARTYAARKGWTVDEAHVYMDDGISGAEFQNRPGFVRLMNALKPRSPFQVLIMSEESRLGREQIEVAYALKQIISAGVRIYCYLADAERTLDSPIEKVMLAIQTMADEMERAKASQRTYDAFVGKAKAGHVTGGRVFGYENVRVDGHVERRILGPEAAIVRRIFELSIAGYGFKAIAKALNAERAPSPRALLGRSQSWAPSSVREVLYKDIYRGRIIWNKTRKRDRWGAYKTTTRPKSDWIEVPAPSLAIVSPDVWDAAHERLATVRQVYLSATDGRPFGRPPLGDPAKHLLTNLALCGCCGGPLRARSRGNHGIALAGRKRFYGCSGYHERGTSICTDNLDAPMLQTDEGLIGALLQDVLDPSIVCDAVDEAVRLIVGASDADLPKDLERTIARLEQERARLVSAIAAGGKLDSLLTALHERETKLEGLRADLAALRSQRRPWRSEVASIRADVLTLAGSWRRVLAEDPRNARPIVSALLIGRVTIRPTTPRQWELSGEGTLVGLFRKRVFPLGWRARQDSNLWPSAPEADALSS